MQRYMKLARTRYLRVNDDQYLTDPDMLVEREAWISRKLQLVGTFREKIDNKKGINIRTDGSVIFIARIHQ